MCNDYEQHVSRADYQKAIAALELAGAESDDAALLPADDIRIGDSGPVLRAKGNGVEVVTCGSAFRRRARRPDRSSTSSRTVVASLTVGAA